MLETLLLRFLAKRDACRQIRGVFGMTDSVQADGLLLLKPDALKMALSPERDRVFGGKRVSGKIRSRFSWGRQVARYGGCCRVSPEGVTRPLSLAGLKRALFGRLAAGRGKVSGWMKGILRNDQADTGRFAL